MSGLALHAEDQQCAREGRYDMTIWTGPETERKKHLRKDAMLSLQPHLHCDR